MGDRAGSGRQLDDAVGGSTNESDGLSLSGVSSTTSQMLAGNVCAHVFIVRAQGPTALGMHSKYNVTYTIRISMHR